MNVPQGLNLSAAAAGPEDPGARRAVCIHHAPCLSVASTPILGSRGGKQEGARLIEMSG